MPDGERDGSGDQEPNDLSLHLAFCDSEDPEAAIPLLTAFVRAHPSCADALLTLALAFVRAGKLEAAKEAIRRARFLAPEISGLLRAESLPDASSISAALGVLVGSKPIQPATAVIEAPSLAEITPPTLAPLQIEPAEASGQSDGRAIASVAAVEVPTRKFEPLDLAAESARKVALCDMPDTEAPASTGLLPDGWMLARLSLELWVRRFAVWALPLTVGNLAAALAMASLKEASLPQAMAWITAFAIGAPFSLRGMAREWSSEAIDARARQRGVIVLTPLTLLVLLGTASAALALRLPLRGEELLALALLVSLPLLALAAPAMMLWVTFRGGWQEGLRMAKQSLSRRTWTYLGVVGVAGSLGGALILTLGWGFISTLGIIDHLWIRLLEGVGFALSESFLLVLIATCGLDALESQIRPELVRAELGVLEA